MRTYFNHKHMEQPLALKSTGPERSGWLYASPTSVKLGSHEQTSYEHLLNYLFWQEATTVASTSTKGTLPMKQSCISLSHSGKFCNMVRLDPVEFCGNNKFSIGQNHYGFQETSARASLRNALNLDTPHSKVLLLKLFRVRGPIRYKMPVERKKALTSGRRNGKNSGSATGDQTQGLWFCAPAL